MRVAGAWRLLLRSLRSIPGEFALLLHFLAELWYVKPETGVCQVVVFTLQNGPVALFLACKPLEQRPRLGLGRILHKVGVQSDGVVLRFESALQRRKLPCKWLDIAARLPRIRKDQAMLPVRRERGRLWYGRPPTIA